MEDCSEGVTGAGVVVAVRSDEFSNGFVPSSSSAVPGVVGPMAVGMPVPLAFRSSSIEPARCIGGPRCFLPGSGMLEVDHDSGPFAFAFAPVPVPFSDDAAAPGGGVCARVGVDDPEWIVVSCGLVLPVGVPDVSSLGRLMSGPRAKVKLGNATCSEGSAAGLGVREPLRSMMEAECSWRMRC